MMTAGVYYATYGHWSQALKNAGYDVRWHWQPDNRLSEKVLALNFPAVPFGTGTAPDIICGSPPCVGFSNANPKHNDGHAANRHVIRFAEFVRDAKPRFFLMEEVTPFLKSPLFNDYLGILSDYDVTHTIIHVEQYGSPARRKRAYVFGVLKPGPAIVPFNLVKQSPLRPDKLIGHLEDRKYAADELYNHIDARGNVKKGNFSHLVNRDFIMDRDLLRYTITGCAGHSSIWHWNMKRCVAIPELQELMGFPPDWVWPKASCGRKCHMLASGVDIRFTTMLLKHIAAEVERL